MKFVIVSFSTIFAGLIFANFSKIAKISPAQIYPAQIYPARINPAKNPNFAK